MSYVSKENLKTILSAFKNVISSGLLKNLKDGNATGSLRGINTAQEDSNYSLGQSSVALGQETKASGFVSYAEGLRTTASEYFSHAEGNETEASGFSSHSEGERTIASGYASHAEGSESIASSYFSHAEGDRTTSSGGYGSHSEGWGDLNSLTLTYVSSSTYTDYSSQPYKTKYRVVYSIQGDYSSYSEKIAKFANKVLTPSVSFSNGVTNFTFSGFDENYTTSPAYANFYMHSAGGQAAHVEGHNCNASGFCSHAEGENTVASNYYTHAEGQNTSATGYGSHAEGGGGKVTHQYAHIEGWGNRETLNLTYSSQYTFTINDSKAYLLGAKVLYNNSVYTITSATSVYSRPSYITTLIIPNLNATSNIQVEVYNHVAGNEYAHVEGLRNQAYGADSHAEGSANIIENNGMHAHVEGYNNKITSYCSHAEGNTNIVSGQSSHVEGMKNIISRDYSHAEGENNIVIGFDSHAEGLNEITDELTLTYVSTNTFSVSDSYGNYVKYKYAINTSTLSNYSPSIYKIVSAVNSSSKTTFTFDSVSSTSDIKVKLLMSYVGADRCHTEGRCNGVYGENSHAEGSYNEIFSTNSHVEGNYNIARGNYSSIFGTYNLPDEQITNVPAWASRTAYSVGDIVHYNECKYKCNTANSDYSFDSSKWTILGKYTGYGNIEIVGNGTGNNARSNARTLDWEGSEVLSGDLTIGASTVSGNTLGNLHARTIELNDGYIEKSSSLGSIISGYDLNVYLKYRSNYDFELTSESGDYTKFYSPGLSVYYNDQKYTITNSVYDTGTNKTILTIGGLMAEAPDTSITVYIKAGMSGGSVFSLGLGGVTLYNSGNFDILSGSNLRASNGSNGTIMCGQYNVADSGASYDLICGKNNFVAYGATQNIISGYNNNALNSSQNNIVGGTKTTVTNTSNNNIISGDTITVDSSSSNIISGYFNSITSGCHRSLVIGQYNNIKEGSNNSIIDGEYNTSQSGASCNLLNGRYLTSKEGTSCCLLNGQYITSGSGTSLCIFNGEYMSSNSIKNSIINGRYYSWENSPSYVLMSGESHNLYSSKSTLLGYGIQSYGNCSLNFGAYNADVQVSSLPSWVSGETYSKGDIVKNGTKAYRCKISNSDAEFDSQKWEDDNKIKYIEIVGNGFDSNDRSNARTLDWSGNEWLAGNLSVEGNITTNGTTIVPMTHQEIIDIINNL